MFVVKSQLEDEEGLRAAQRLMAGASWSYYRSSFPCVIPHPRVCLLLVLHCCLLYVFLSSCVYYLCMTICMDNTTLLYAVVVAPPVLLENICTCALFLQVYRGI